MGKELYFVKGADQWFHKSTIIKCCFSNYKFYLELFTNDEQEVSFFYIYLAGTQFSSGLRYNEGWLDALVEDLSAQGCPREQNACHGIGYF